MESPDKIEFLSRIPMTIEPQFRFIMEAINVSLFSVEPLYNRLYNTLAQYNEVKILEIDIYSKSNIFSDVWAIIDNTYMSIKMIEAFLKLNPIDKTLQESQAIHIVNCSISDETLFSSIDEYINRYKDVISRLRNMADHLYQNIKMTASSSNALPIQGSISYCFRTLDDVKASKCYIISLTKNTFTQETCNISLPNPADKMQIRIPVDCITLCAIIDRSMKTTKIDISDLIKHTVELRNILNQQLEKIILENIKNICLEKGLDFDEAIKSNASGLILVVELTQN